MIIRALCLVTLGVMEWICLLKGWRTETLTMFAALIVVAAGPWRGGRRRA